VTPRLPQPRRPLAVAAALLAVLALAAAPPAAADYDRAERQRIETLPAEYRAWLEEVELIITGMTDEELAGSPVH
jgi:hypothetical protein